RRFEVADYDEDGVVGGERGGVERPAIGGGELGHDLFLALRRPAVGMLAVHQRVEQRSRPDRWLGLGFVDGRELFLALPLHSLVWETRPHDALEEQTEAEVGVRREDFQRSPG